MKNKLRFQLSLLLVLFLLQFPLASAASKAEIDANVKQAIAEFYKHSSAGKELAQKASSMPSGLYFSPSLAINRLFSRPST